MRIPRHRTAPSPSYVLKALGNGTGCDLKVIDKDAQMLLNAKLRLLHIPDHSIKRALLCCLRSREDRNDAREHRR